MLAFQPFLSLCMYEKTLFLFSFPGFEVNDVYLISTTVPEIAFVPQNRALLRIVKNSLIFIDTLLRKASASALAFTSLCVCMKKTLFAIACPLCSDKQFKVGFNYCAKVRADEIIGGSFKNYLETCS